MNEYDSFLVTVLYGEELLRCAVKTKSNFLEMTKVDVRRELPAHIRSCGPVVRVERIFDVALEGLNSGET